MERDRKSIYEEYNRQYNRVIKESDELYHSIAKYLGLSDSAFEVLYFMYDLGEGCTQKDICQVAFAKKQTVHSAIQGLERDGVLRMEPGRGREVCLFLTENGRKMVEEKIEPVIQQELEALGELTQKEIEQMLRLNFKYLTGLRDKIRIQFEVDI